MPPFRENIQKSFLSDFLGVQKSNFLMIVMVEGLEQIFPVGTSQGSFLGEQREAFNNPHYSTYIFTPATNRINLNTQFQVLNEILNNAIFSERFLGIPLN